MIKPVDQERLDRLPPAPIPNDDGVDHAARVFCGNDVDLHAVLSIRAAFATAQRNGHLRYFVENCSALCGRRLRGAARAYAVMALAELPMAQWPYVASSAHSALEPTMRPVEVADLVRAVAKLLPIR